MRIARLENIADEKEYQYKILDFKSKTKEYKGIELFSDKIRKTMGKNGVGNINNTYDISKAACVDGVVYAITKDASVYRYVEGGDIERIFAFEDIKAEFIKIIYSGREGLLVMGEQGGCVVYFDGEGVVRFNLPVYSEIHATLGHNLFLAVENRIIFENFADLKSLNDGVSPTGNFIELPKNVGDIYAIIPEKKKLIIFCQKAIYELIPSSISFDFEIKKRQVLSEKIVENSVCRVGEGIAFISDGKVCRYFDGKIEKYNVVKNLDERSFLGKSQSFNGKYTIPFSQNGERRVFFYDFNSQSEGDAIMGDSILLSDGYFFDSNKNLYRFSDDSDGQELAEWESVIIDFDSADKKAVKGVSVNAQAPMLLDVKNSYSLKNLVFNRATEYKKTNLTARSFIIKATGNSGLSFDNLKLKYTIRGE